MKIVVLDTYYPEAMWSLETKHPECRAMQYHPHLDALLYEAFGTADFWSRNLRACGHEVIDIIGNHLDLQQKWAWEHGKNPHIIGTVLDQIRAFDADVVICQDANFLPFSCLDKLKAEGRIVVAQVSCPMPAHECLRRMDLIWTSFPHYVWALGEIGVPRVEYMTLAFEPDVMRRIGVPPWPTRDLPITFVGGVGANLHWKAGTAVLEAVAAAGIGFEWWGYGIERLAFDSPLRTCYQGEAWGLDMYRIYARSKIVLNRHGEVAQRWANCMRIFEATGMGAHLCTNDAVNLQTDMFHGGGFAVYRTPAGAVAILRDLVANDCLNELNSSSTQREVLERHTFALRMKDVSDRLYLLAHRDIPERFKRRHA